MHRVLLVTDGSPNAWRAARTAADMVRRSRGEILIVYVIPSVTTLAKETISKGGASLSDIVNALRAAMYTGHEALTQAANILTRAGIPYTAQLEQGIPAVLICEIAQHEQCDAIVIGSGGLDRTTALALGAVSKRTGGCAARSVVIVS